MVVSFVGHLIFTFDIKRREAKEERGQRITKLRKKV